MRLTTGRFALFALFFIFLIVILHPSIRHSGLHWVDTPTTTGTVDNKSSLNHTLTQLKRLERLRHVCDEIDTSGVDEPSDLNSLYVNDEHKFIYCEVPKVACTNWKRILLVLSKGLNTTNPSALLASDVHNSLQDTYLKKLSSYPQDEIDFRLKSYFKFMFVREPLERLLSAYKNKFTLRYNTYFHERYGVRIIQRFRKNATAHALTKGNDVTFGEFIQYILDPNTVREGPYNAHWRQYHKLCQPCHVQYDFIGHFDSLDADIRAVLERLQVNDLVDIPKKPTSRESTAHALTRSYADISSDDIRALWQIYSIDYKMFGYEYPDIGKREA